MVDDCNKCVFYLLPELRRSSMWAIGGCTLIAGLIIFLQLPQQPKPLIERIVVASFFMIGAIWLAQYLLPRIKVDEAGISKRVLWWWTLWPWEAFEDGRIHQGIAQYGYLFSDLPWWSQRIELSLLSPEDSKEIDALIRRIWQPASAGPLPEQLELQFKWPKSQKLLLSPDRIAVSKRHQEWEYGWDSVLEVVIWRLEKGRADFRELHLKLPDRDFVLRRGLHQGSEVVNWTGASSGDVGRYILDHIPPECAHDFALTGKSTTLKEAEARRSRIVKEIHSLRRDRWAPISLIIPATVLLAVGIPWPKNALMGTLYCPIVYAVFHLINDRIRELQRQLLELDADQQLLRDCELK